MRTVREAPSLYMKKFFIVWAPLARLCLSIPVASRSRFPPVKTLGARHSGYGVTTEHYRLVGGGLLWTPQRGVGVVRALGLAPRPQQGQYPAFIHASTPAHTVPPP